MKKLYGSISGSFPSEDLTKDPPSLHAWMVENLKYHGVSKKYLFSPEEVLTNKKAHCWEGCSFEYKYFTQMGFECHLVYLESLGAAVTHSTLFFKKLNSKEVYWFEWAWGIHRGIYIYKTKQDFVEDLAAKFKRANKSLTVMTQGDTVIGDKTLSQDYYLAMTQQWEKLSPKLTPITPEHKV